MIAVPPVNHVTLAPTATPTITTTSTPTLAPAAPPSIGPAAVNDSSQSISRVVGTQPDPSAVVPNARLRQQQSHGGELNDNFPTEDWGKGHNRYGARVGGSLNKRADTPPRNRIDTPPSGGTTTNTGPAATVTSVKQRGAHLR